jgi:hypothetical protein
MNRRVDGFDPDAAVAPRRYGLDSLYGNYPGHHSMSGIKGGPTGRNNPRLAVLPRLSIHS